MYLHIIDDTNQINSLIKRSNELFGDGHVFYILSKTNHVKNVIKAPNVFLIQTTSKNLKNLLAEIGDFKAVFIHNLCYTKAKIILKSPDNIPFVWVIWGFDYYNVYPELYKDLFLPWTKIANAVLLKYSLAAKRMSYFLHPFTRIFRLNSHDRIKIQAAKKISYTVNNMPRHSDVFKVIPSQIKKKFNGIYYSIDYFIEGIGDINKPLGVNIFVGNSATNSSNHIDVFFQLRKILPQSKKVIVSLGYGCIRYKKLVNISGKLILKNSFVPMNQYLPLPTYHKMLLDCNVMIFNQKRAQAIGNILFGVWAGHKIFLRKSNPVYYYLKDLGVAVFSIEDELDEKQLIGLESDVRIKNRRIIEKEYSEEHVRKNYLEILNSI